MTELISFTLLLQGIHFLDTENANWQYGAWEGKGKAHCRIQVLLYLSGLLTCQQPCPCRGCPSKQHDLPCLLWHFPSPWAFKHSERKHRAISTGTTLSFRGKAFSACVCSGQLLHKKPELMDLTARPAGTSRCVHTAGSGLLPSASAGQHGAICLSLPYSPTLHNFTLIHFS